MPMSTYYVATDNIGGSGKKNLSFDGVFLLLNYLLESLLITV
jgi:hypothetical protein